MLCNSLKYRRQFPLIPNFFNNRAYKWSGNVSVTSLTFTLHLMFQELSPPALRKQIQSTWLESKAQSNSQYYWQIFVLTKSVEWFTQVSSITVQMFKSMTGCLSRLICTQARSKKQTSRVESLRQPDWPSVIEGPQGKEVPGFPILPLWGSSTTRQGTL